MPDPVQQDDLPSTQWTEWPARRSPAQTALLVLAVLVLSAAAGARLDSTGCGLLVLGLLVASMANYLLPIRYAMDESGLTVRGLGRPSRIKWSRTDAARLGSEEALLLVTPDHRVRARQFRVYYHNQDGRVAKLLRQHLLDAGAPLV